MTEIVVEVVVQAPPVVEVIVGNGGSSGGGGGSDLAAGPGLTIVGDEIRFDIESLTRG